MDNKKTRCEIVEVGMPSTHFPLCDKGVPRNCIDITIKEIFLDGSFLRHAGSFTVYESELGQYVDFAKTRFSSYFGKIFVRDLGKYLR